MESSDFSPFVEALNSTARGYGFPVSGAVDVDRVDLAVPVRALDQWLSDGSAGEMGYIQRGRDRRADPRLVFPEVKSVFSVLYPYSAAPLGSSDVRKGVRYARYLRGRDYHLEMTERLEKMMSDVRLSLNTPDLKWKVCVDTSAVLERHWAAVAGLGWIGKNTLLIHPKLGSYTLIGTVFMNRLTGQRPRELPDYCGNCDRCLRSCPTKALPRPRYLDSRRCMSYWTLEKRTPFDETQNVNSDNTHWIAGCDLCQEVCPFNTKVTAVAQPHPDDSTQFPSDFQVLESETEDQYIKRVRDSALNRVKPAQFRRNLTWIRSQMSLNEP